jgi:hypothetical protein
MNQSRVEIETGSGARLIDRFARVLAMRGSRRAVLGAMAAAVAGGGAATVAGVETANANERCRPASMSCGHWSHCCSLKCRGGQCVNSRNAGAADRRQSRKKRRRQDRRHDQRVRRKQRNRRQRRETRSASASAKTFTGNVKITVVNSAGRTLWFDLWQADGSGHDLALAERMAGMLGGGQRSRTVTIPGGRVASTLRMTNDLGVDDWLVEIRRSEDGSNVSLALGAVQADGYSAATIAIPRWDTRKADLAADPYTLLVPDDFAEVNVLKILDDGETVEVTIEVRDVA